MQSNPSTGGGLAIKSIRMVFHKGWGRKIRLRVREQRAKGFGSRFFNTWASCALFVVLHNKFAHSRPPKGFRNIYGSSIGGGMSGSVVVFM
jgi:hypothetical protein